MHFPSSVMSSRERLLLIMVDGSATIVPLNNTELPSCFEIDTAHIANPNVNIRPGTTAEHILKVLVVASDWTLLAESLPVRLDEPSVHATCGHGTFELPDVRCLRLPFPREPSVQLVELIERNRKPNCGSLNHRIDGVWSHGPRAMAATCRSSAGFLSSVFPPLRRASKTGLSSCWALPSFGDSSLGSSKGWEPRQASIGYFR